MAELIWEGKYRDNKRVAPVRLVLPFQTVETVNESAQDRMRTLGLFAAPRCAVDHHHRNRGERQDRIARGGEGPASLSEFVPGPHTPHGHLPAWTTGPGCDCKRRSRAGAVGRREPPGLRRAAPRGDRVGLTLPET